MSKFVSVLKVAGVIAGVVLIGVLVGLWAGRQGSNPAAPAPPASPVAPAQTETPTKVAKTASAQPPDTGQAASQPQVAVLSTNLITDWEDRLDQILGSEGEDADKAKQLLEMFPRLPPAGQEEVAQHISNLTADKDYAPLGQYLTNSALPGPVLEVLMQDLLNRPNSLKLPLLLEIAREDRHPNASEAKDLLELYLEENYGTDWNKWREKMQQWLQENPD